MDVSEFKELHFQSIDSNEQSLLECWSCDLLPVLRSTNAAFAMVERPLLHSAIEVILALRIRSLLTSNIGSYVRTLESLHETRLEPFIAVRFACSTYGITIEPDFAEMERVVMEIADHVS